MGIKDRLIQFIDFKGITKRQFTQKIDVSHSYIDGLKTMQSDKISKISEVYPELNINWLLLGKGEMLNVSEIKYAANSSADGLIDSGATDDIMALNITTENKILMLRDRVAMQAIEIRMLNRLVNEYEQKLNKQNIEQQDKLVN